ncbi:MAG TPA: NAD(P)H-hydrate epimerase [Candidatus Nanoarchaeia archaeon]|nr:NAD(P)H-hydrate epimerase [Candidatus Nanoarchaeia archaeon]
MISTAQMKRLEARSIGYGVSLQLLMERSGKGVYKAVETSLEPGMKVLVVCYHGNNGGDGFVAARYIAEKCFVDVLSLGEESKMSFETMANFIKLKSTPNVRIITDTKLVNFNDYNFIIDAIFGTGLKGHIHDPVGSVILRFNRAMGYKVSIDVPSGIDPDSGKHANVFVVPNMLVALHDLKKGLGRFRSITKRVELWLKDERRDILKKE